MEFSAVPLACMAGHMHRKPRGHEPTGRQKAGPDPHRRHQARAEDTAPEGEGNAAKREKKPGGQPRAGFTIALFTIALCSLPLSLPVLALPVLTLRVQGRSRGRARSCGRVGLRIR